jgi:phytoene synthase
VTRADLRASAAARRAAPAVKNLIRYEVSRARQHYTAAAPGIPMLASSSQACIRAAFRVYGAILTEIERRDFDVFAGRAVVPTALRLGLAARCLATPAGRPVSIPRTRTPEVVG